MQIDRHADGVFIGLASNLRYMARRLSARRSRFPYIALSTALVRVPVFSAPAPRTVLRACALSAQGILTPF